MHTKKLMWATAIAAMVATACGTGTDSVTGPENDEASTASGGFAGVEEVGATLTPLATACAYLSDGGMTITLDAGEFVVIGQTSTGDMRVNGTACGTATATELKKITINGNATGNETVILDYLNGAFALGQSATVPGVVINLKGGTGDSVKIRGSNGDDIFALGTVTAGVGAAGSFAVAVGIGATPDAYRDITITGAESVLVSVGPGADTVNGAGNVYGVGTLPFGRVTSGTAVPVTIYGGDGADVLTGGDGADTVSGDADNDTINGSAGADTESGGAGDDTLNQGSAANGGDTLSGGAGTGDVLNYGSRTAAITVTLAGTADDGAASEADNADNTFETITGGTAGDTITCDPTVACTVNAGAGDDTIVGSNLVDAIDGEAGDDTITPGTGNDTVVGGAGTDTVSYSDRSSTVDVTLADDGAASTGNGVGAEDDSVATVENIVGGTGNDNLTGNNLDNVITGGLGDDVLAGAAGNDTFYEGTVTSGADTFNGGAGEDTVDYSGRAIAVVVTMDGVAADDGQASETDNVAATVENCNGGSGNDTITGNTSDNKIDGGDGNDTLNGGTGADEITGGAGDDTLDSGAGDDTIDPGAGTNTATCGAGFDILVPSADTTNGAADCEVF